MANQVSSSDQNVLVFQHAKMEQAIEMLRAANKLLAQASEQNRHFPPNHFLAYQGALMVQRDKINEMIVDLQKEIRRPTMKVHYSSI